jgi:hypothetical protein
MHRPDKREYAMIDDGMMVHLKSQIDVIPSHEFDDLSRFIYDLVGNHLSTSQLARDQYKEILDYWEQNRWYDFTDSLRQRLDKRTLFEFAMKIHHNYVREKPIMHRWLKDNGAKHSLDPNTVLAYNGVEDTGRVIFDATHDEFKKTDFAAGEKRLELKLDPTTDKATYKQGDLLGCERQDALVLTLFTHWVSLLQVNLEDLHDLNSPWVEKVKFYTLMWPADYRKLMNECKLRYYSEFGGTKPSYQVTDNPPRDGRGYIFDYSEGYKWGS